MNERFAKLRKLHIPKPCSADWNEMTGDDKTRHCTHCSKSVHDLSAMTAEEAEAVLGNGRVCVRFSRDRQGRIITKTLLVAQAAAIAALSVGGCQPPPEMTGVLVQPDIQTSQGAITRSPDHSPSPEAGEVTMAAGPDTSLGKQAPPEVMGEFPALDE